MLVAGFDALFPPRCLACDDAAWDGGFAGLCALCADRLPILRGGCRRCGRESGGLGGADGCPVCRSARAEPLDGLDGIVASLRYRELARELVLALKFRGRTPAAIPLGRLLADALRGAGRPGDLVVPVPLSNARARERGHNQADDLAIVVARALDLPRDPRALVKRRHTHAQAALSRGRRHRNPRGAFRAVRARVEGRCVLLVDDVVTTGATAAACGRALRRAGALHVVLAAACRA